MRKWMYLTLLALTAAAPAKHTTVNTIGARNSAEAIKLIDQPCNGQPAHDRASAVCAQWIAADTGKRSAVAGEQSASYALLSAIFAAATVVGLIGTLLLTIRANKLASKTAERQLRAYVSVRPTTLILDPVSRRMEVGIIMHNDGTTPAYQCIHAGNIAILTDEQARKEFHVKQNRIPEGERSSLVLHANQSSEGIISSTFSYTDEQLVDVSAEKLKVYAFGFAEYQDTFAVWRHSHFCFSLSGERFSAEQAARANLGKTIPVQWLLEPFHNDAD